jgi:hypothetical protein
MEEVGVEAEIMTFNRHVEANIHERSRIRTHFVIASFVARGARGEPRLSDEFDAVDSIDPVASLLSPTTPELGEDLMSAARIESRHRCGAEKSARPMFDDLRAAGMMNSACFNDAPWRPSRTIQRLHMSIAV